MHYNQIAHEPKGENMVNGQLDKDQLLSLIERIEHIEEDEANLRADKKEIYKEAKDAGYDPKYVRKMVALRKMDQDELDETDEVTKLYRKVLGL